MDYNMSQHRRAPKSSLDFKQEHVVNMEEEQYEEMLYYQAGDIVFAKHHEFLWPAKVVKPLNNYQQYKIFLFEIKIQSIFQMKNLIDYNPSNRSKSVKILNLYEKNKNTRQKFFIALRSANYYYKQLKRKEEEATNKQKELENDSLVHKHHQIEQEMSKEQINSNIDSTHHKEDPAEVTQRRNKKKQHRPFKFSREVKNIVDQDSFRNEASMRRKTRMQERFSMHHQFSINHQQIISNSLSPSLKAEQAVKDRPQCRRMRQRMLHKSMNRQFNYFTNQKDIAGKEQLILQQKEMMSYLSLYQAIFQELDLHLATLQSLPEAICIKICSNALDKLFKALTETKRQKFPISNFLPLLKKIFGNQLIKIERMISHDILVRMLIVLRTSKQQGSNSQLFKAQLQYMYEVCRQLKIKYILGDQCSMSVKQKLQQIFRRTTFED